MTIQRRKVLSRSKKLNDREIHDMREIVEMAKDELTQRESSQLSLWYPN